MVGRGIFNGLLENPLFVDDFPSELNHHLLRGFPGQPCLSCRLQSWQNVSSTLGKMACLSPEEASWDDPTNKHSL